jgi:alkylation response protein AidB-like acyl-CoA dehydrogenase
MSAEGRTGALAERIEQFVRTVGARCDQDPRRDDHGPTQDLSMAKVGVSEALFRVADRCVQVMGDSGYGDTIVQQVFREVRSFRIDDRPTEAHKWSLAKRISRDAGAVR